MKKMVCVMLGVLFLSAGCNTLFPNKPDLDFPSDIEAMCESAMDYAEWAIESKGTKLEDPGDCTVTKHLGEKKLSGYWSWYDPAWQLYVGGLCSGDKIEVGCNPATGGEVGDVILKHEFAHYWLMDIGDYTHDAKYADLFFLWREPRAMKFQIIDEHMVIAVVKTLMLQEKSGALVGITFRNVDNRLIHIDFIKE